MNTVGVPHDGAQVIEVDGESARLRLTEIARLLLQVAPFASVSFGCGRLADMEMLRLLGAPLHTSYYVEDRTAIDSREIKIGGVSFRAQGDKRSVSEAEWTANEERKRRIADLEAEIVRLRNQSNGPALPVEAA